MYWFYFQTKNKCVIIIVVDIDNKYFGYWWYNLSSKVKGTEIEHVVNAKKKV